MMRIESKIAYDFYLSKSLESIILLFEDSIDKNNWIFNPFSGSSTTGIAANLSRRRFLGIEKELDFVNISKVRRNELNNDSKNLILHLTFPI